jgi:hypothetical protein
MITNPNQYILVKIFFMVNDQSKILGGYGS